MFISIVYIVLGSHVSVIRRINCINTTSGVCHSVQMTVWCANLHTKRSSIQSDIPYVLIQSVLLMMDTWLPEKWRE
jgi:hypothetical protein